MAPSAATYDLANNLFQAARSIFGICSTWYQERKQYYLQLQEKRLEKRRLDEDRYSEYTSSITNTKKRRLEINSSPMANVARAVSPESGEEKSSDEEEPPQCYPVGTPVSKHFPGEGWFQGTVEDARWGGEIGHKQWIYSLAFEGRNTNELVDEMELKDLVVLTTRFQDPTLYTFEEFLDMWDRLNPEQIEKSSAVRGANKKVMNKDSEIQQTAQYGRILPEATAVSADVFPLFDQCLVQCRCCD
jgi:hypothetical protein